jgi:hypothetical protein
MLVKLKRDFFLAGKLYAASPYGTEMPEEVGGKPLVFAGEKREGIVLPRDAERLDVAPVKPEKKAEPTALSEMTKKAAKPKSFVEAMSDDE